MKHLNHFVYFILFAYSTTPSVSLSTTGLTPTDINCANEYLDKLKTLSRKTNTIAGNIVESKINTQPTPETIKPWTFMVYISADNDLRGFAARNIKQMAAIGSSQFVNIVVHLDIKITGNRKITRRYYIENGKINHMNENDPSTARMDSGSPETLISFADWAINNYPAEKYCLILWNHGTGPIDPGQGKIINPSNLFTLNQVTNKWELDRSIGFLDYIDTINKKTRGICWDDTTGNYLTNQSLEYALKTIKETILGKKLSIIGFDACLMSTIEITNIVKNYAHYCVASEEVEMGTGWKYSEVLAPFLTQDIDEAQFAAHIVQVYKNTYEKINDEYTLSAINLGLMDHLESALDSLSQTLVHTINIQKNSSVTRWIKTSKSNTLQFDEPSYIDLHHFLHNLLADIQIIELSNNQDKQGVINDISQKIKLCTQLIEEGVIENTAGSNVAQSAGISIYFPEKKIHHSYAKCNFALQNNWYNLITSLAQA